MQQLTQALEALRVQHGPWSSHNIEVAPGVYTIGDPGLAGDNDPILARAFCQQAADSLRKPFSELRVLDLGCLEGLYAIEMALHGAEAVGIDARKASIDKATFAKQALNLDRLSFCVDDVRNVNEKTYGSFDVVLCLGLLYHLDFPDVFHVLKDLRKMCRGVMILDTHISLFPHTRQDYEGTAY